MKKFSWILALLAALAVVFVGVGCGGGDDDDGDQFARTEALDFDLAAEIEDAEITSADVDTAAKAKAKLNPIGINLAGEPKIEVTATYGLKVDTDTATWGAGIDLMNSVFNFQVGDVITVKGKLISTGASDQVFISTKAGAGESHGFVTVDAATKEFTQTITLTAADLTTIRSKTDTSPDAIRIGAKPGSVVFEITELTAVGDATATPPPPAAAEIKVFGGGFTYTKATDVIAFDAGDGAEEAGGVVAIPVPAAVQTAKKVKVTISDFVETAATAKAIVKVLTAGKTIADVTDANCWTILTDATPTATNGQYVTITAATTLDYGTAAVGTYIFLQHNKDSNPGAKYSFKVTKVEAE